MILYGAGLAGLLAGNILRKYHPKIYEAQSELPNNHSALLRFRTSDVGTACSIPFKRVKVSKAIKSDKGIIAQPNLYYSNMYSQKVTNSVLSRSIDNLETVERYIAPENIISQMASDCNIVYDYKVNGLDIIHNREKVPLISTLPMPTLMKIIKWKDIPEFPYQEIWTQKAIIDSPEVDIHQTIYYPDPNVNHYRISVIGNIVISESIKKPDANAGSHIMSALYDDFGFRANKLINLEDSYQKYGKIRPINEKLRKEFIYEMTSEYNIYSIGRFATWRQLLLDDVVNDIQVIEKFISKNSNYEKWMHKNGT